MRANFCAYKILEIYGNWYPIYKNVIDSLLYLGYDIHVSNHLILGEDGKYDYLPRGLDDESPDDLFVYNHTNIPELKEVGLYRGNNPIIIKPTGPTPKYFSLDTFGYACAVSITYDKPDFEGYDHEHFFSITADKIIGDKDNKWSDRAHDGLKSIDLTCEVPENHVLVLGQMPGDTTVVNHSFGDHWVKIQKAVDELLKRPQPIVLKLHPDFAGWCEYPSIKADIISKWEDAGVVVIDDFSSLHDVLPKTKVAVLENSTAGIECLIHKVPIISFGYPEYHWITKDLRHIDRLNDYIEDMSWFNEERAKSFVAWYCEKYLCYDMHSTLKRLKLLLNRE